MCRKKELSINEVLEMIALSHAPENTSALFEALDDMESLSRAVDAQIAFDEGADIFDTLRDDEK